MKKYISTPIVLGILGNISASTLRRIIKEDGFPLPEKVGRSLHFDKEQVFNFLSDKSERKISHNDHLLSSKQLEKLFNRSSSWVWLNLQKDKKMHKKAVYIRSKPFWFFSDIECNDRLSSYLKISVEGAI